MKIFLDFDDVLFHTRIFRRDFVLLLEKYGMPREVYEATRSELYSEAAFERGKCYDFEEHLRVMGMRCPGADIVTALKAAESFLSRLEKYVFSDVKNFLRAFPKDNLCILSFGEKKFQNKKIQGSGLVPFVHEVYIVDGDKGFFLSGCVGKEEKDIFFLDDRERYMREVKRYLPDVTTILVSRPEGRYTDLRTKWCDFQAGNMVEARAIIDNNETAIGQVL